jgi:hypothetical protein
MIYVGIDPGLKGGLAAIDQFAPRKILLMPFEHCSLGDISYQFKVWRDSDTPVHVLIENPSLPMFNRHSQNNFSIQAYTKLYRSIGHLEGIAIAHNFVPEKISPIKWQNRLNCRTGGDKKITHARATKLFPFLFRITKAGEKKSIVTHAVADALLIALYNYLQYADNQYVLSEWRNILPHIQKPKIARKLPKRSE